MLDGGCAQRLGEKRLEAALIEIVPEWTMAPVVAAFQAMRGVRFITAVTLVAEAGDLRRFEHPRQLMAFLGLVPSERSTGRPSGKAGSPRRIIAAPAKH
jgi:transposase